MTPPSHGQPPGDAPGSNDRSHDPLGKDALFGRTRHSVVRPAGNEGRRALFSAPPRREGTVVIECSSCEARTPVSLRQLAVRLIPSLWLPGKHFSQRLRCPTCRRMTWCQVHWGEPSAS